MKKNDHLEEEAKAFDKRINERLEAGFIPDLRRAVKCEYFYKSFWRDPHFIRLYLGHSVDIILELLKAHCGENLSILDVGCGAGYMSLELARNGYDVTAIDISSACINAAKKVRDENPFKDGFGSLKYKIASFDEAEGEYDVLMFTGSLHHMDGIDNVAKKANDLTKNGGCLLCLEPCHELFTMQDAAQVALIRGLLSITGFWFEDDKIKPLLNDEKRLLTYIRDLHIEYILERDANEAGGQSPNDLSSSGDDIKKALGRYFKRIEIRHGTSFIYRLLGGMRGPQETLEQLSNFLTSYDRLCCKEGYMNPNYFFYIGRKLS